MILAVFILETSNASGRLWAIYCNVSFSSSFDASCMKTDESRIMRLDDLNSLLYR